MCSSDVLKNAIFPYLEKYDFRVSVTGIRYGSVAYIGFGQGALIPSIRHGFLTAYPIELEFGADEWILVSNGEVLIYGKSFGQEEMRELLAEHLVGKKLTDIMVDGSESRVSFGPYLSIISKIAEGPASGFLYMFGGEGTPVWATADGVSFGLSYDDGEGGAEAGT